MTLSDIHNQKSTIGRTHPIQRFNAALSRVAPGVAAWAAGQLFMTVIRHRPPEREAGWAEGATEFRIPSPHGDLAAWKWGHGPKTVLLVHDIHDRDDRELPAEEGEALARVMLNGSSLLTRGLGHRRILRDAGVVGTAVEFIASQSLVERNEEPPRRREIQMSKINQRHPAGGTPAPQWRAKS